MVVHMDLVFDMRCQTRPAEAVYNNVDTVVRLMESVRNIGIVQHLLTIVMCMAVENNGSVN